ncbi:hypothetical protein, partial [Pseudomonas sp. AH2 (2023)]|uniref:hypothetical protein n=1 Tax=Pseudomonas sp. AH2 (2023) TaxID=3048599 RepID=UPI002B221ED5
MLPLESVVADARPIALSQVREGETFARPRQVVARPRPDEQSIQFRRPVAQIEHAKRVLGVSSASAVCEKSFDYFYA